MNPKKSPIHENADAKITCDFGDGDISRSRSFLSNTCTTGANGRTNPHSHVDFLNLIIEGIMFASFRSKGTVPSCSDMLNTWAIGILICYTVSFSILCDIPSTPGDLFSFILLILLATTSGVTTNLSPSDPLNVVSGKGNEQVSSLVHI